MAFLFSVVVLVLYLFEGSRRFDANRTSITMVIVSYFLGGLAGGVVVGALLPLTRWLLGSALVGVVAVIPIASVIQIADMNAGFKQAFDIHTVLGFSLYFGGGMGAVVHIAKKMKWF